MVCLKQLGWFVAIWAASIFALGLVSLILHYWLG
jgi:Protein of unknown function (DUF2474)